MKRKVIFEPDEINELMRGWLLHAHKGRDRHDLAARNCDQNRTILGMVSAGASAAVATAAFSALTTSDKPLIRIAVGSVAVIAAVLASLQTFLDLRARADLHRVAGIKYKAVIRRLEQLGIGVIANLKLDGPVVTELRGQLDALEAEMPVVSLGIYKIVEESYEGRTFINSVEGPNEKAGTAASKVVG